ncbi:hypothetical protein ACFVQB_19995 [Paenibacillus sp. NPDC057886]|uniref:hypothetical protein n=1 Tax=Paenibacillus sp. NPDC057886 TaxID=3346270 RepID=UPI0036A7A21D
MWFEQFTHDTTTTSAFEHVFIGEEGRKPNILDGHHFWYHYYINDGPYELTEIEDSIYFVKYVEVGLSERSKRAEFITIKYAYEKRDGNGELKLFKKKVNISMPARTLYCRTGIQLQEYGGYPVRIHLRNTYVFPTEDDHSVVKSLIKIPN